MGDPFDSHRSGLLGSDVLSRVLVENFARTDPASKYTNIE
jgi:hypothetical protein